MPPTASDAPLVLPAHVVFFDGVCGLCDRTVGFLIARDRGRALRYAPLQGETARKVLGTTEGQEFDTLVLLEHGQRYERSDAAWRICRALGGIWALLGFMLRIIPRPLRNFGYRMVASRRYAWFGKKEACRMPRPGERELFLP